MTDGGRVVTSAALGDTVAEAREKALAGARQVRFPGAFFRSDIAGRRFSEPVVGVILGSKSDLPLMESCVKVLEELGLAHEVKVCSAHRNPRGVMEWATSARERGIKVVIAAAGGAAHLPGVVAAWTDLPVIGVPVPDTAPRRRRFPVLDRADAGRDPRRHRRHRRGRGQERRLAGRTHHRPDRHRR